MLTAEYPLFTLSIVLIAGVVAGRLSRQARLPSMTGQIVAGVLLSPTVLGLISAEALHSLRPLTHFALGLIAVAVGNHLVIVRLRNSWRRLLALLLFEISLTPLLVVLATVFGAGVDLYLALMLGTMAIATAPATVVAIVQESRARGVFVKTLIAAVALNNMACILLFEIARELAREARDGRTHGIEELLLAPVVQLFEPLLIGLGVGLALIFVTRRVARSEVLASMSIAAILFAAGLSEALHVSPLLACLFLGVTLANVTPDKDEIGHQVFADFENAIFAVFFTLAGMELDFAYLAPAGALAGLFVLARFIGKVGSAGLGMAVSQGTRAKRRYLGLALIPQAGVAIGLVLIVQTDELLTDIRDLFLAVGITAVAINEIIGPLTTRFAIAASGEVGRDRRRVIDFLQEEHILTNLGPIGFEDAVRTLAQHLNRTHPVKVDVDAFVAEVIEREHEDPSTLGEGLAIPYGHLEEGELVGVMGISREGLIAPTPDAEPIHCVVLLASPGAESNRHLEVLAAFAKAIGSDRTIQHELYVVDTPAHAYELLHSGDAETFNHFLEELDDVPAVAAH
jgi:PTS system fructose-specific IIC component